MSIELAVIVASLLSQLTAVLLAVRLIHLTGKRIAGLMIVATVFLMAFRRGITLYRLIDGGSIKVDLVAEVLALVIAVMILAGVLYITRLVLAVKAATADLETSEERHRTLADASFEGIAVTEDGRLVDLNQQLAAMLGYARDELLGRAMADLVAPEDRACLQEALSSQGESPRQSRLLRKDGTGIVVESRSRHFALKGRELQLTALRDITERTRIQESLQKTSEILGAIVRCSPLAVICTDADRNVMMWNPAAERLFGWSEAETLGRPNPIVPQAKREEYLSLQEQVRNGQPYASLELECQRKDGTPIMLNASSAPLCDSAGNVIGLVGVFEDITRRKRMEGDLAEREALLEQIMDTASVGIGLVDMNGRFTHANTRMARLFGCGMAEFLGSEYVDHVHPAERDAARTSMLALLRSETQSVDLDRRYRRADGTEFWGHLTCNRFYDAEGNNLGLIGAISDITGRKHAEEAIAASESRYRSLFEDSPISLWEEDFTGLQRHLEELRAAGVRDFTAYFDAHPEAVMACVGLVRIEAVNKATLALYEAPDTPTLLQGLDRVFTAESFDAFRSIVVALAGGATVHECEAVNQTLTGRRINVLLRWALLADDGSGRSRTLISILDISGRKRAEEQIRQSEQFIRSVLDSVDEGFIVVDRNFVIKTANKAYCAQVGLSGDEVIGNHCYRVSHRTNRPCYEEGEECAVRQVFASGRPQTVLHKHRDGAGQLLFVETKGYPILDAEGRVASVIETITNITERHLLEEERLKSQKLESIGTLAGGIAHDFNNLLQGVFGYISLAKMTIERKEQALAMLTQAEQALHLSVNLTSQLLTFSKGGQPVKKLVEIAPIVENAAKFALSGSRSDFRFTIEPGLWPVNADAGQIGQVVQNIVLNADQAMPLGGRVSIGVRNVPPGCAEYPSGMGPGGLVCIAIEDTGTGIPAQYLSKIFDPYFTTKEKGSGLGLATSYSIVHNHGGRIEVRSAQGAGTTFLIYLPASPQTVSDVERAAPPAAAGAGRFLLMDDEEVVRAVTGELLEALGHQVEFAEHGAIALERYRAAMEAGRPYDAVILDLTIRGGLGGLETLQRLRELDPAVKAIVSSGYSDDAVVANHAALGFRAFLKKPYNLEELRQALNAVLA